MKAEVLAEKLCFFGRPVALSDFYFYWSLHPVAAIVLRRGFIVSYPITYCFVFQSQTSPGTAKRGRFLSFFLFFL